MESELKEDLAKFLPNDPELIDKIVNTIKSKGIFDQFRKDCLADVDTKPAYQNLQRRVNGTVNGFLNSQKWPCAQNKTQLRESLRKHTVKQSFLEAGVDRIVDQVVVPKIFSIFLPKVEEIVYEALGLERPAPKPKPLLDLKLDFQNFKKSLEESVAPGKGSVGERADAVPSLPAPPAILPEESIVPVVKEEEESLPNHPEVPLTPPPLETNGEADPAHLEASTPTSEKSVSVLNNDDDSNTIDVMPLLAASIDTNSNRAVLGTDKNDSNIKADSSDSDSHSFPSTRPPVEFDSSNNLSSLKSDFKESPSKKFDNFSNLGEKLKQSDVNLRETTPVKAEEITEESSEVTKSSEHDSESIDMEVHSDSNTSAMERFKAIKNENLTCSHHSDDSMSSMKSKSKSQDSRKNDKSHRSKHLSEDKSKHTISEVPEKEDKDKECTGQTPDKKEQCASSNKPSDSKYKHRDGSKDESKSHRHRDDEHRSKESHSSENNGKHDYEKERVEKKEKAGVDIEKKSSKSRTDSKAVSEESHRKKKRDEKSRHSKDDKDRSDKKVDDKAEDKQKDSFKTPEKENKGDDRSRSDRHRSKSESNSKSSHSKTGDRKSRDGSKKDDKKYKQDDKKDDDRKKDSKKKKSGKCNDDDSKSKNSRRSSDRDSNGNAGGASDKSKGTGSSQTPKKSSKSEQKTRSRYKDPSNSDALEVDNSLEVTDEVDLLLLQVNNSIENEQHRLDVREILSDTSVTIKPKIAKNFHEIRKIMQARKNIGKLSGVDVLSCPSNAEMLPKIESEPHSADTSAENDTISELADKIELKGFSVVMTDVLKDSSMGTKDSNWDFTSDVGVSIFLGRNDEIVRVEQGNTVSDLKVESGINDSAYPMKSSSECGCVDEGKETKPQQNMSEFAKSAQTEKTNVDLPAPAVAPIDNPQMLIDPSNKDDGEDDKYSVKSERSDSSKVSSKIDSDWAETADTDSTSSRKSLKQKSGGTTLPNRSSSRKNAGVRMYAILGEVSTSKHTNSPADRSAKKQSKLRSNSDAEQHGEPSSPKVALEKDEHSSMVMDIPRSKVGADDGSDVSNKENDETSASGTSRSKNQKVDQPATVETRSTRRKNPVLDKADECANIGKTDGKNSGTKTRMSLSSKNDANDPGAIEDDESEKSRSDVLSKHSRQPTSLLSSDTDDGWLLKTNPSSSSKGNDPIRKSLECLQMEKENVTVKITTSYSSESNSVQTPSPRRKSCPDILHPRDHSDNKDPARERGLSRCESISGSHSELTDASKTDSPHKSKLSKTDDLSYKKFEYHTRRLNSRRKSVPNDKLVHKRNQSNERGKLSLDEELTTIEEPDDVYDSSNKIELEKTSVATTRKRKLGRKMAESDNNDCPGTKKNTGNPEVIGSTAEESSDLSEEIGCESKKGGKQLVESSTPSNKATVRPRRKIVRPSRLSEATPATGMPLSMDKANAVVPSAGESLASHSDDFIQIPNSEGTDVADETKQAADAKRKHKKSSKIIASGEQPASERNPTAVDEAASKGLSEVELNHPPSTLNIRNMKNKRAISKTSAANSLLEDSGSSSSLEFKGFSEEDAETDSEADCLGFSDGEIQKAATQLRLLTHFIANRQSSGAKLDDNSHSQSKKVRMSLEGSCASQSDAASLSTSKAAKKRQLSLSTSPEKDKKDELMGQCKAESKDSGLCESPEQPSFTTNLAQKTIPVERRTPVNGIRSNPVRTPSARPTRNKTETSSSTDTVKSRNTQSYSSSDLYKPRPSFARDVRAAKRTSSSADSSTVGRPKKRSR